jgi:hypothetical protein
MLTNATKVEFYSGGVFLGAATNLPYSFIWTNAPVGTNFILAVAQDASGVAVGSGGVGIVVEPSPILSFSQITGSNFTFNVSNSAYSAWTAYASEDLTNWAVLGSVTLNGSGTGSFNDNAINGLPHRFYKLSNGVYTSRIIGFERTTAGPGYTPIANQLEAETSTLDGLFNPGPDGATFPSGTQIEKWNGTNFDYYTWTNSAWFPDGNITFSPGEGAFISNATSNSFRVTFVGLVREGTTSIPLTQGQFSFVSAPVPLAGGLQTALGYVPNGGGQIQVWNTALQNYTIYSYRRFSGGGWYPSEPTINIGQPFFVDSSTNNTWTLTFFPNH